MSDPKVRNSVVRAADSGPSPVGNSRPSGVAGYSNRRLELMPPARLVADQRNARTHSQRQIGQIARSIERFGFINPVLIDDTGQIIAGHGRVEAAKRLGLDYVPVLRVSHLSAAERKAYALADNRLAELAGWDRKMLVTELQALIDLNFEVELTGFDIGAVDVSLHDADEDRGKRADPGDERPRAAVTQGGDQWLLGHHRLFCGDTALDSAFTAIDIAIRRWQSFTGKSAILAGADKTFAEVEKERASAASADAARRQTAVAKPEAA
jgi:ParB-like chromosome segregation protein Spo0J